MIFNSKTLKDNPKIPMMSFCGCPEKWDGRGYIGKGFYVVGQFFMFKFYYPIENFYRRTKERVSRSIAYARFGWLNYDFDMAYVWHLFEFKLKRLEKCLKNGLAIQEPEDMAALKELIKIVRRQRRGDYENRYYRQHNRKWGKIESKTTPNYDENGKIINYSYHSWRKGCPKDAPAKLKKQERADMKKVWANGEKDRIKDIKRLAEIIEDHGMKWWD